MRNLRDPIEAGLWAQTSPKERRKSKRLKYKYDVNLNNIKDLAKSQNYCCDICKKEKDLVVDHDHSKNENEDSFRGLICSSCNLLIGFAYDNVEILQAAINYLNKFKDKEE